MFMKEVLVHYTDEQVEEKIVEAIRPIVSLMESSAAFKEAMRQWIIGIVEENDVESASRLTAGIIANAIIEEMEREVEDAKEVTVPAIDWENLTSGTWHGPYRLNPLPTGVIDNHPCSGCSQYARILKGENVVCHCTVPYINRTAGHPLISLDTPIYLGTPRYSGSVSSAHISTQITNETIPGSKKD